MGRIRTTVATALDGVIGSLTSVRNAIAGGDGGPGGTTDLETAHGTTDLETADGDGLGATVSERVGTGYEYQKTALRHPLAAQRTHLSALRDTSILSTDFLEEAFVATESVKRDRVERIHEYLEADRTIKDDARDLAATVDWSQTWEYGKYGFLVGSRYRKRLPVGDAYAPVAGAVAGGAVGAVAGATDRTLVDVDPDHLFDRIDAASRLRDDPVARARVTRETLRAVDRRLGDDDVPVERLFEDDLLADLVTREDEVVPESIPGSPRTRAAIDELIWGDPLSGPSAATGAPSLPSGRPEVSADGPLEDVVDGTDSTDGEPPSGERGDRSSEGRYGTRSDEDRDRSTSAR